MKWIIQRAGVPGAYLPGWFVIDPHGFASRVAGFEDALGIVRAGIALAHIEAPC